MPKDLSTWLFLGAVVSFAILFIKAAVRSHAFDLLSLGLALLAGGLLLLGR